MWYWPSDLLPGPMKEEPDALDLHLPRLARCRRIYRSSYACVHSFVSPTITHWRYRNRCFSCGDPVTRKCRTHGTRMCGDAFCKTAHRICCHSVSGSLTKPLCEYSDITSWKMHLLRIGVSLAVGLAVMALVAL
jgi:hypothetical protein